MFRRYLLFVKFIWEFSATLHTRTHRAAQGLSATRSPEHDTGQLTEAEVIPEMAATCTEWKETLGEFPPQSLVFFPFPNRGETLVSYVPHFVAVEIRAGEDVPIWVEHDETPGKITFPERHETFLQVLVLEICH